MIYYEAKLKQLTRLQYQAGYTVQVALKNIRQVFGFRAVNLTTVYEWFKKFEKKRLKRLGKTVTYESKFVELFPDGAEKDICRGMLLQLENDRLYEKMTTVGGRFGFAIFDKKFIVVDLFHGEMRTVPCANYGSEFNIFIVDDEHLLLHQHEPTLRFVLLRFDFDAFELTELDSIQLNDHMGFVDFTLDQLNKRRFMAYSYMDDNCIMGRVEANKIVIEPASDLGVSHLFYINLVGTRLFALKNSNTRLNFCTIDLETKVAKFVDVSTEFGDSGFLILGQDSYFWSQEHFYAVILLPNGYHKIVALNTRTCVWTDTGIKLMNEICTIFVDKDEFLTVVARGLNKVIIVYRFPLKKPDSLNNLSWFSYSRRYKMTDMDGYKKLIDRLPYTCNLRLQFPEDESTEFKKTYDN